MERIKVVTDSAADIPTDIAQALGITIIPLLVIFGQQSYDDLSLSREEFWRLAREVGAPKTSQPAPGIFRQVFQRWVDEGYRVLCLTLTGRHSGTFSTAWSTAQAFGGRVTVVDSQSLSWGLGWQAIEAAKMALQGATMERILEALRSLRERMHLVIQLDTVEYLRRGGRASRIMPAIDRLVQALQIKPLVTFVEGELRLLGVARSYQKGVQRIREEIVRLCPLERVAVMHTRREALARQLADELSRLTHIAREQIFVGEPGAVLSCHAGEGVIAAIGVRAKEAA